jgi:hypothetical protein
LEYSAPRLFVFVKFPVTNVNPAGGVTLVTDLSGLMNSSRRLPACGGMPNTISRVRTTSTAPPTEPNVCAA